MHKLEVNNLVKTIKKTPIVRGMSLEVNSAEVVGLLGPNGAGKTTTFYMICGLVKATSGDVYFDGENISHMPLHQRALKGIGYLPQESSIFKDITVEELAAGIRRATVSLQMVPVLCGSALRHRGIHQLLDAAVDYLPSPLDVAAVRGVESKTGDIIEQPASAEAPLTALAFKVIADQHVGRVVYVRVYSGVIRSGATVYNPARRKRGSLLG